jgi:hypothetical protein
VQRCSIFGNIQHESAGTDNYHEFTDKTTITTSLGHLHGASIDSSAGGDKLTIGDPANVRAVNGTTIGCSVLRKHRRAHVECQPCLHSTLSPVDPSPMFSSTVCCKIGKLNVHVAASQPMDRSSALAGVAQEDTPRDSSGRPRRVEKNCASGTPSNCARQDCQNGTLRHSDGATFCEFWVGSVAQSRVAHRKSCTLPQRKEAAHPVAGNCGTVAHDRDHLIRPALDHGIIVVDKELGQTEIPLAGWRQA